MAECARSLFTAPPASHSAERPAASYSDSEADSAAHDSAAGGEPLTEEQHHGGGSVLTDGAKILELERKLLESAQIGRRLVERVNQLERQMREDGERQGTETPRAELRTRNDRLLQDMYDLRKENRVLQVQQQRMEEDMAEAQCTSEILRSHAETAQEALMGQLALQRLARQGSQATQVTPRLQTPRFEVWCNTPTNSATRVSSAHHVAPSVQPQSPPRSAETPPPALDNPLSTRAGIVCTSSPPVLTAACPYPSPSPPVEGPPATPAHLEDVRALRQALAERTAELQEERARCKLLAEAAERRPLLRKSSSMLRRSSSTRMCVDSSSDDGDHGCTRVIERQRRRLKKCGNSHSSGRSARSMSSRKGMRVNGPPPLSRSHSALQSLNARRSAAERNKTCSCGFLDPSGLLSKLCGSWMH